MSTPNTNYSNLDARYAKPSDLTAAITNQAAADSATYAPLSFDAFTKSDLRTVLCIGDSMTAGNQDASGVTYPGLVQTVLGSGVTVVSDGHSGWTSTDLGIQQGGINVILGAVTLPNSIGTTSVTVTSPTKDFRSNGTTITPTYSGTLAVSGTAYTGTLVHNVQTDGSWTFAFTTAPGAPVTVPAGSIFHCTADDAYTGAVVIIWVGRNNVSGTSSVVADVAAMVAHLSPQIKRYLVLSVLPTTTETTGTAGNTQILAINAALAAAYGNRYVDIYSYLRASGLSYNGLNATTSDTTAIANGTIPPQLKWTDGIHPNQYGYRAVAGAVTAQLVSLGWTVDKRTAMPGALATLPADYTYRWKVSDLSALAENASVATWPSNASSGGSLSLAQGTPSKQPTVYTAGDGKRYVKFDGVSQELSMGATPSQPFTFLFRGKLRSINANNNGIVQSAGSPGIVFAVNGVGAGTVYAGSGSVATSSGQVTAGTNFTLVGVFNGTGGSSVQVNSNTAATSASIGTASIVTYARIGYAYSGGDVFTPMDVEELVFYNRVLASTEISNCINWFAANE